MIPVFATIGEGLKAAFGFTRAYKLLFAGFLGVYAGTAAFGASGLAQLPLPVWVGGQISTWLLGAIGALVLAPTWAAVLRFAVLRDTERRWWQFDRRSFRVGVTMLVIGLIALIGAAPFALGLDVLPRIGPRRMVALVAIAVAVMVKLGALWLNARLAIAPVMAATGTKPQALDVSFGYTRRAAWRLIWMRLIIYLPLLAIMGGLGLAGAYFPGTPGSGRLSTLAIVTVAISALLTAITELVDGAVMARAAPALVKAQRARAQAAAQRARAGLDDDD